MKRLVMVPEGWPCTHAECRPGFFLYGERLCFKDEYGSAGGSYCDSGEAWMGGTADKAERGKLIVQPVTPEWEFYEE